MEYKGTLQRWNDEKGFGFIVSEHKGQNDVFLHISELKNMGRRPVNGDIIFYQIYMDTHSGKIKAVNARIENVSFVKPYKKSPSKQQKNTFLSTTIGVIFLAGIFWFAYEKFSTQNLESNQNEAVNKIPEQKIVFEDSPQDAIDSKSNYQCDGRQHCSQMTSCAEAEFFMKNCPDTKMDGDRDGEPCENMCRR